MKKGSMALLAVAIVLVLVTSIFVVAETPKKSEEVIITSSDLPYQGWRQDNFASVPNFTAPLVQPNDTFESVMAYGISEAPQAIICIVLLHFNSTDDAKTLYDAIDQSTSTPPHEPRAISDKGFIYHSSPAIDNNWTYLSVMFVKDNYLVAMNFGWQNGFAWGQQDSLRVAQIQADKIS